MFNFFDFILSIFTGGELGTILKISKVLAKGGKGIKGAISSAAASVLKDPKNIKGLVQQMLKDPKSLAKGLSKLEPKELAELNDAIDKARDATEKIKDKDGIVIESKALSSTWLVHAIYEGDKKSGKITITTKDGRSYNFPVPIQYSTWEKMKKTRGRAGTGAGTIFHREYWDNIRGKKVQAMKKSIIFKLAGL